MKRFWPLPLWMELVAAVLITLLITNAATALFFRMAWQGSVEQRYRGEFAERAAHAVVAILNAETAEARERLVKAMSGPGQRISISSAPAISPRDRDDPEMAALVAAVEPSLAGRDIRVSRGDGHPRWRHDIQEGNDGDVRALAVMSLSVQGANGTWVNANFDLPVPFDPTFPLIFSGTILITMLMLVAFFVSRRVVQPLRALETAARALGPGDPPAPVPERGPAAVKAAIRSFNAMSQRLLATLESQRVIMAAVAHDLRSPITSLRLRTEFVADVETKERMLDTLAEMQTMTEAVIDLARAGKSSEAARPIDLNALAESLVEDMAEAGGALRFAPGPAAAAVIRRSEVTRAIRNLVENALRYGGGAAVSLEISGGFAAIQIDDDGPGVPADQLDSLFMPFARLEESRSKETGGHGLGLTIARMIARGHGGDVTLANRTPRGLRATLRLPLAGG